MRGDEDTGQIPQRGRGQQRVALEHVERGPGEGACPKGGHDERGLVDELAPRTLISWAVGEMAASSAAPVIPVRSTRGARRTIEDQLSEKILFGEIQPGQIIICDVEGWDGEEGTATDKAVFTFRGETKPANVPDAPPVDMAASSGGEGSEDTESA